MPPEKCPPGQRNQAAKYAGRLCEALSYWQQAREWFWVALQADWQDAEAMYHIGALALHGGQVGEAEHWFTCGLQYPERPASVMQQDIDACRAMPYYGLACLARARGDRRLAYQYLDQAEWASACEHPQFADLRCKLDKDN